jgi:magnesium-transporting ATPase (P-type)
VPTLYPTLHCKLNPALCNPNTEPHTALFATPCAAANVVRDGKRFAIEADQLVPGDIVAIKSGDRLPADLRLLQVRALIACAVRPCEVSQSY